MLVEDNPAYRKSIAYALNGRDGINLSHQFGTAEIAIQSLLEMEPAEVPEVILLDLNLPGMSGLEALDELKKIPGISGTPVIAVSANAMLHDVSGGMKAGFVDYLTKPFEIDVVIAAIRKATIHSHS